MESKIRALENQVKARLSGTLLRVEGEKRDGDGKDTDWRVHCMLSTIPDPGHKM